MFILLAVLIVFGYPSQSTVIDLTSRLPHPVPWKISATRSGGPIGAWPRPAAQLPVTVRLTNCIAKEMDLYFSLDVYNNRETAIEVPVSIDASALSQKGTIRFRQLLIELGSTGESTFFKSDRTLNPIILYGSHSIAGTSRVLAPKEHLTLKLRTRFRSEAPDLKEITVQITGADITLLPRPNGSYEESDTWIPALRAASQPALVADTK
jgi:hypothetical protein